MALWYTVLYVIAGIVTWMIIGRWHANMIVDEVAEYNAKVAADSWFAREQPVKVANSVVVGFWWGLVWPLTLVGGIGYVLSYGVYKLFTAGTVRKFFTGYSEPVWKVNT